MVTGFPAAVWINNASPYGKEARPASGVTPLAPSHTPHVSHTSHTPHVSHTSHTPHVSHTPLSLFPTFAPHYFE